MKMVSRYALIYKQLRFPGCCNSIRASITEAIPTFPFPPAVHICEPDFNYILTNVIQSIKI